MERRDWGPPLEPQRPETTASFYQAASGGRDTPEKGCWPGLPKGRVGASMRERHACRRGIKSGVTVSRRRWERVASLSWQRATSSPAQTA